MRNRETARSPEYDEQDAGSTAVELLDERSPKVRATNRPKRGTRSAVRTLRVLIVDDHRTDGPELARRVRGFGHEAGCVQDGLAALRRAAWFHPDLVFLNMELPRMDGCRIARHLRHDFPRRTLLIVGIAARVDPSLRRRCKRSGVELLLARPIGAEVVETLCLLECELVNRASL